MHSLSRYVRLWFNLGRYALVRELAFRGNYLAKLSVELLWLAILLVFYRTVFARTSVIATWSESEYLFFVGCYFALEGLIETLFLENCNEFSDLIRSGNLDFYLLKPIDEQFLISCQHFDWSTAPNFLMGAGVMGLSLYQMHWTFAPLQVVLFLTLFICGTIMAYCFLLTLTSAAIWFTRNQSLFELWWLFTSLMRYPREIFTTSWAAPIGWFFTFIIPILLVVNLPASVMVKVLDYRFVGFMLLATVLLLLGSRRFFRYALRKYRSASS
jgi:ABC-2 type transport system permease protein